MANDHLNTVERKLIDNLRNGTYKTIAGADSGSAWASGAVTVFGQFPEPEDVKYPCIILELAVNGIEEQFMGQRVTSGSSEAIGELYGVAFNIHLGVDQLSAMTVEWTNATCDFATSAPTKINMDDTALVTVGATVSGTGVPASATVTAINSSTQVTIDKDVTSTLTDETLTFSAVYKQRRLLNYLMLNCADILMDCDFDGTTVDVVRRQYTGFRGVGYDPQLELWFAQTGMVIVFLNTR